MTVQKTLTEGYRKVQDGMADFAQKVADSDAVASARKKGHELARRLEKGSRELEAKAQKRFEELRPEIERAGKRLEEAMASCLRWVGLPRAADLESLSARIDDLARRVEEVQRLMAKGKAAAGAAEVFHLRSSEGGWELRAEGAGEAESTHGTKKQALAAARELLASRGEGCRVVVHKMDGEVQTTLGAETGG